ncbi:MAG: hypothetical protein ACYCPQ_01685 [Elusimicrobiota bacterium]
MKKTISEIICGTIILFSPGLGCYQALAEVVRAANLEVASPISAGYLGAMNAIDAMPGFSMSPAAMDAANMAPALPQAALAGLRPSAAGAKSAFIPDYRASEDIYSGSVAAAQPVQSVPQSQGTSKGKNSAHEIGAALFHRAVEFIGGKLVMVKKAADAGNMAAAQSGLSAIFDASREFKTSSAAGIMPTNAPRTPVLEPAKKPSPAPIVPAPSMPRSIKNRQSGQASLGQIATLIVFYGGIAASIAAFVLLPHALIGSGIKMILAGGAGAMLTGVGGGIIGNMIGRLTERGSGLGLGVFTYSLVGAAIGAVAGAVIGPALMAAFAAHHAIAFGIKMSLAGGVGAALTGFGGIFIGGAIGRRTARGVYGIGEFCGSLLGAAIGAVAGAVIGPALMAAFAAHHAAAMILLPLGTIPAHAAAAAGSGHAALTIGAAGLLGAVLGFGAGALIGWESSSKGNSGNSELAAGIGLLLSLARALIFGLGGALLGSFAGSFWSAHALMSHAAAALALPQLSTAAFGSPHVAAFTAVTLAGFWITGGLGIVGAIIGAAAGLLLGAAFFKEHGDYDFGRPIKMLLLAAALAVGGAIIGAALGVHLV